MKKKKEKPLPLLDLVIIKKIKVFGEKTKWKKKYELVFRRKKN